MASVLDSAASFQPHIAGKHGAIERWKTWLTTGARYVLLSVFALFLSTTIVPFEVVAIPLYLEMKTFNWVNSYEALIIPWVANALGIFLLRQFFADIPRDLIDAAKIDGCSHLSAFRRIVIPNAVPAMITFALIRFQASWDSFLWPLIVAPSPEKRVVQVAI